MSTSLRLYITIIFVYFFCIAKTFSQKSLKIYVDPASAPGIKASKFIEHIDFIPLETTQLSKFKNAGWLIATKDKLVVTDDQTIYVFDKKTGTFLHKFQNRQKRYEISSIQYVPNKNAILIKSTNKHYTISKIKALQLIKRWKNKDISKYVRLEWLSLNPGFKQEQITAPSIALNTNLTYFDKGFIYRNYGYDKYAKDSILYRLVQYDSSGHVNHRYFPFLNLPKLWSSYENYQLPLQSSTMSDDTMMLFQLDFNPTIYELKKDTLIERYKFILPMTNVMPANLNSLTFNSNIDVQKYKEKNKTALMFYFSMIPHGKYLFFGAVTIGYKNTHYMLSNARVYNLDKLTTDSSIFNLPPNIFSQTRVHDNNYLYTTIGAEQIMTQKDHLLADKRVSEKFKAYLKMMTKDDNPIAIRIKLK